MRSRLPDAVLIIFASPKDETGRPHLGQAAARSDTDAAQSGQVKSAIAPNMTTFRRLVEPVIMPYPAAMNATDRARRHRTPTRYSRAALCGTGGPIEGFRKTGWKSLF